MAFDPPTHTELVVVTWEEPYATTIDPYVHANPCSSTYWEVKTVTGVPETVMGWLVGQGWKITAATPDSSTVPPTYVYNLEKATLNPMTALVSLCNEWTTAVNRANEVNAKRYNDVMADWNDIMTHMQEDFVNQVAEQNESTSGYLADMDGLMDAIETAADAVQTAIEAAETSAAGYLSDMATTLADLVTQANANATAISGPGGAFDDQNGYLSDYLSLVGGTEGLLDDLEGEHNTHATTATGYLAALNTAELKRINEEFEAKLSVQVQQLIDQGAYNDVKLQDITQRNLRDRDEQVQLHENRLLRERLDNEHKLYGQQFAMRSRILQVRDRLHALQQEISRMQMAERDVLLGQSQDATKGVALGQERRGALTMQFGSAVGDISCRVVDVKMREYLTRLDVWTKIWDSDMRLMQYQLDKRNELLVWGWGFIERREDVAPEWKDMVSMFVAIGDAGGVGVQP